ncbi:hypothetical protein PI125_g20604 [Phytophthora idaei]|nr:hypothetical protein PI125_g20604 [Phytophthora idaei]
MYWLGGQPGRVNHEGRSYDGPLAEHLATLARKDKARYTASLENVLDPLAIDNYGYLSVRSLLESTEALDPKVSEKNCLSLPALARVRRDIMSSVKPMDTWAGSRTEEPWKPLVNNYNINQIQDVLVTKISAGTYEIPTARPESSTELQREDWPDFEEEDGEDENPLRPLKTLARRPTKKKSKTKVKNNLTRTNLPKRRPAKKTKKATTNRPPTSDSRDVPELACQFCFLSPHAPFSF